MPVPCLLSVAPKQSKLGPPLAGVLPAPSCFASAAVPTCALPTILLSPTEVLEVVAFEELSVATVLRSAGLRIITFTKRCQLPARVLTPAPAVAASVVVGVVALRPTVACLHVGPSAACWATSASEVATTCRSSTASRLGFAK